MKVGGKALDDSIRTLQDVVGRGWTSGDGEGRDKSLTFSWTFLT